ncbi:cytochrome P450 [Xylariaceae sp. FL0804]|nr:cytochrome P450 [Xylariaceae sp. FL0804]
MALTALTAVTATLVASYVFLRLLIQGTQDAREPPAIETGIPFIGPLIGMAREKALYYIRLRDTYPLPIYTLRLPFSRIYIVNATELIPVVQKQWKNISFAAMSADAGPLVGLSKEGCEILRKDITSEHGFSNSWPKHIIPALGPGEELDAINRKAVEIYSTEMDSLRAQGPVKVGLWQWSRRMMLIATCEAVWGPQNPYRDPEVAEAWRIFESGFLTLTVFPSSSILFPKLIRARERAAAAMIQYMRNGGYKTASGLVRKRFEHHTTYGLSLDDMARGELGNTFAVLGNSTPCALWVLYHVFSNDRILSDIRQEISAQVQQGHDGGEMVNSIDLSSIRDSCPVLLSTFQEVLRYRALNTGPRLLVEDAYVNGFLLKKGSMLMIPAPVQHTAVPAWGEDVNEFDYLRFASGPGRKKPNKKAFRAFGGGHVLCPGRHFASTEIMALTTLLVLQCDVTPVGGKWVEPSWKNSPAQAGFPVPDHDIEVELKPRSPEIKWRVTFSGSDKAMGIVSEDSIEESA